MGRWWENHLAQVLLTKPAEEVQEACQVLEKHGYPVKEEVKSELYYSRTLSQVVFQELHYANLIVVHAPIAQGHNPQPSLALVLPALGCCILLLLVPKMVSTLCNLHQWCFSWHQLVQRPHLHLKWALSATCAGGVFLVPTSTLSKVHI